MNGFRLTNLCMVSPAAFGYNAETAATNRFQRAPEPDAAAAAALSAQRAALREFEGAVSALRAGGLAVCVAQDTALPPKPDAIFPNNWVSFHEDGTVVLYPMRDPSRRLERNEALIERVKRELGFIERRRLDLSGEEKQGRFLEGTGSLVLDRAAKVAWACRSPRTDEALVREWARQMDYEPVIFDACSPDGTPVYHTNVLLWVGARAAGCGFDWIDAAQREHIAARLRAGGGSGGRRCVLALDTQALLGFAGNMLDINRGDMSLLAASHTAWTSLTIAQQTQLRDAGCTPVLADIPTIEALGGGSLRCMLAEVPAPAQ
ncbi:MAG: hypothetical protein LBE59_02215 [Nevskiaceae bacterium]|jgi:hypothetical protein|nr:hypothetical protein [Nevskiaceae bacterium]